MSMYERVDHYTKMFFGRPLTPRQVRRINQKDRKTNKSNYIKESLV